MLPHTITIIYDYCIYVLGSESLMFDSLLNYHTDLKYQTVVWYFGWSDYQMLFYEESTVHSNYAGNNDLPHDLLHAKNSLLLLF